ncbi:DUF5710 domain-containing protein [Streptomyces smyrnaeus]
MDGRLYLRVPYDERYEARQQLRAQWDASICLWYVDAEWVTRERGSRWLP